MVGATSKIASTAVVVAAFASLCLLVGLAYAKFLVSEPPPNVVITFSNKAFTRLSVELISLGMGGIGLVLALVSSFTRPGRGRLLALAVVSNVAICALCIVLLV